MNEVQELEDDFAQLEVQQEVLATKLKEYKSQLSTLHRLQDELSAEEKNCQKQLDRVQHAIKAMTKLGLLTKDQSAQYHQGAVKAGAALNNIRETLPHTGSRFLGMFVGQVNVVLSKMGERLRYKREYELFKQNFNIVLLLFCCLCIYMKRRGLDAVFQTILVYYYITLTLREKILKNNGSNIKRWWTWHHYLSCAASLTILTWPAGASYQEVNMQLYYYFIYLGLLQMLQTRYQVGRLYALRALGRAGDMDVANTDSTQGISGLMYTLLPLILFGQGFQVYNAYTLLSSAYRTTWKNSEWQAWVMGAIFLVLATGNFYTTLLAYYQRFQRKTAAMKKKAQD